METKEQTKTETETNANEDAQRKREMEILKRVIKNKELAIERVATEKLNLEEEFLKAQQEKSKAIRELAQSNVQRKRGQNILMQAIARKDLALERVTEEKLAFERLFLRAQQDE
jgi:hypothetical protein